MAKVLKKRIWWSPVPGSDVVGYRVYVAPTPQTHNYSGPYVEVVGADKAEIVAPDGFPAGTFTEDADYNVWITTLDDVGNESDPLALSGHLDFIPPSAPAQGGIVAL